jgi:rubrerythrin
VSDVVAVLQDGRRRERAQAFFYRMLAGDAEAAGNATTAERLNELLADEQHHVSRLTARLLELGETPTEESATVPLPELVSWEAVARVREEDEVRWYEQALHGLDDDEETLAVLREILSSERHHCEDLAGKWMPAGPSSASGTRGGTPAPTRQEDA